MIFQSSNVVSYIAIIGARCWQFFDTMTTKVKKNKFDDLEITKGFSEKEKELIHSHKDSLEEFLKRCFDFNSEFAIAIFSKGLVLPKTINYTTLTPEIGKVLRILSNVPPRCYHFVCNFYELLINRLFSEKTESNKLMDPLFFYSYYSVIFNQERKKHKSKDSLEILENLKQKSKRFTRYPIRVEEIDTDITIPTHNYRLAVDIVCNMKHKTDRNIMAIFYASLIRLVKEEPDAFLMDLILVRNLIKKNITFRFIEELRNVLFSE